jgi:hypothetical protein
VEEAARALGSGQQALMLAHAQQVRRGTAADELRPWRMAPFIDAVLQQRRSRFLLRAAARLQRCAPALGLGPPWLVDMLIPAKAL